MIAIEMGGTVGCLKLHLLHHWVLGFPDDMFYSTVIYEPQAALHILISTFIGEKINILKNIIHIVNSTPCNLNHFRYFSVIMVLILGNRNDVL